MARAPPGADDADADAVVRPEGRGRGEPRAQSEGGAAGKRGAQEAAAVPGGAVRGHSNLLGRRELPGRRASYLPCREVSTCPMRAARPERSADRSDRWRCGRDGRPSTPRKPTGRAFGEALPIEGSPRGSASTANAETADPSSPDPDGAPRGDRTPRRPTRTELLGVTALVARPDGAPRGDSPRRPTSDSRCIIATGWPRRADLPVSIPESRRHPCAGRVVSRATTSRTAGACAFPGAGGRASGASASSS